MPAKRGPRKRKAAPQIQPPPLAPQQFQMGHAVDPVDYGFGALSAQGLVPMQQQLAPPPRPVKRRKSPQQAMQMQMQVQAPQVNDAKKYKKKFCIHGRPENGYLCKECPGKGICKHLKQIYQCKECKGSSLCKHGRQRHQCKEMVCKRMRAKGKKNKTKKKVGKVTKNKEDGTKRKLCIHGRSENGYLCVDCPGKGICVHLRQKYQCKECGGTSICPHGKQKHQCAMCKAKKKKKSPAKKSGRGRPRKKAV